MNILMSAMDCWSGRIDSEDDYESFRWHQVVRHIDLYNSEPFEGKCGFVFIGFCSDQGIERNKGREGSALAPNAIRRQMSKLPCNFTRDVKFFDAGNIMCETTHAEDVTLEEAQELLADMVAHALKLNLFPIVLGGGHETAFGHYTGLKSGLGAGRDVSIVNFDAHFDMRPYDNGNSSGSMFRQIADICSIKGEAFNYMPIGIQKHSNTVSLFKTAREMGVNYILAKELQSSSFSDILYKVDSFVLDKENIYITICADVFSSAFAPGVSATQSLGLDPEIVMPIIRHIVRTGKVRGFDVCEVSPRFDQDDTTANLAAVLIFSVVNTLCESKGRLID